MRSVKEWGVSSSFGSSWNFTRDPQSWCLLSGFHLGVIVPSNVRSNSPNAFLLTRSSQSCYFFILFFFYFLPLPPPPLRLAAQSAGQVERRGQKRSASNLPTGSTVIGYFLRWLQDPVWESFIEFLLESISFPILFQTCSSSPPSRDALSFETVAAGQDLSPWTAGSVIRCEEGILCRPESTHSTGDDCTDSSMLLGMRSWMSRGRYLGAEWNGLN